MTIPTTDLPGLVPVRCLNEFAYCPRLGYLEWVQGEFEDNVHTMAGTRRHTSVDTERGRLPEPDADMATFLARAVKMSSDTAGIISIIDILEGSGGAAHPVEIKKGKGPKEGAWPADEIQIGAQALIVRDNGYTCESGFIYYSGSNRRVEISLDTELERRITETIAAFRECAAHGRVPPPLEGDKRCIGCSLVGICLPDETRIAMGKDVDKEKVRLLYPARDDTSPLMVQGQGSHVGKSGEEIVIKSRGKEILGKVKMLDISSVCLFGNVQISTQALSELLDRGIPVCYFSYGGWFRGITHGMNHKNVELRMGQYSAQADNNRCMELSRNFIDAKIRNCRTLLRRNNPDVSTKSLEELKRLAKKASECEMRESLLGIEGAAARAYFLNFGGMLRADDMNDFNFEKRNRRPPRDPINAMLSYCYSMLVKDMTVTALRVGFDPFLGFFHQPRYGRPALALDMMEEFRPIIADSVVIGAVNNGEIRPGDFTRRGGAVAMSQDARKSLIRAYERRMNTLVTHPVFGYQVSYRRVLELQLRLLARYVLGEISEYRGFMTR